MPGWLLLHSELPSCDGFLEWGSPALCPFTSCLAHNTTFDLSHCNGYCDTKDDLSPLADRLYCIGRKPWWVSVGDRYHTECLSQAKLRCRTLSSTRSKDNICSRCLPGSVKVNASQGPVFYLFDSGAYYTDFCPFRWQVGGICRTCTELGCPGSCKSNEGCTSCPAGSVLLKTRQPQGLKLEDHVLWCPGRTAPKELPRMPSVCKHATKDLRCAGKKFKDGVGCTACPKGLMRSPIRPDFIAGSQSLQLQPEGYACY